jgi:hypothetical protein
LIDILTVLPFIIMIVLYGDGRQVLK